MFDAHCHLQFDALSGGNTLDESRRAGVRGIVSCDYDSATRERLRELAQADGVWATCGLHPWAIPGDSAECEAEIVTAEQAARVHEWVGIGEFGLDATRTDDVSMPRQYEVAERLFTLAKEMELPVVLHIVHAEQEMLERLDAIGGLEAGGMCHGFAGTPEQAKAFIDRGLHISIGTNAVRGNVGRIREVCRAIPKAWMLVETDAPSRPPDGVDAPNHPRYLHRVVEAVARFVNDSTESIAQLTEENARRLFRLDTATL